MIASVGYLGPEGTFSHLVAQKRYGRSCRLVALPSIAAVFDYVRKGSGRAGVVPIENSSGGTIYETVDCLIADNSTAVVLEEFAMRVNLALLGRKGQLIETLYSHFAPLSHCETWIRENLPHAVKRVVPSTAIAAETAAREPGAAALATKQASKVYGLEVLRYPVEQDIPNVTQFFAIGSRRMAGKTGNKTSLVARLANRPGSLLDFLTPFKEHGINLTRILSRPIMGQPNTYVFFVDLEGAAADRPLRAALAEAGAACQSLRCVGVYPVRRPYQS